MLTGRLTTVNSKGIGFIQTDEEIDYFLHHTGYNGEWRKLVLEYIRRKDNPANPIIMEFDDDPTATEGPRAINARIRV